VELAKINKQHLIYIHLIAPLLLILVFADFLFFNQNLKSHLPSSPFQLLITLLFFQMPHVISSQITLLEKEYFTFYKYKLLLGAVVISALVLITPYSSFVIIAALLFAEALHASGQQFGLINIFANFKKSPHYKFWRLSGALIFLTTSLLVYHIYLLPLFKVNIEKSSLKIFLAFLYSAFFFYSIYLLKFFSKEAQKYTAANLLMVTCCIICFYLGYFFFVVLITKLIHDTTSYFFYINHDLNRFKIRNKNIFYRILKPRSIPTFAVSLFISFSCGMLITISTENIFFMKLVPIFLLFHYYTEHFIWKSSSIHRKHVAFN
jgi:hypothetical protein